MDKYHYIVTCDNATSNISDRLRSLWNNGILSCTIILLSFLAKEPINTPLTDVCGYFAQ